ncbi:alpha/beta hydrolase [Leptospira ognonensis]|uniref:Alpha/beta hydrolase n=1 Tax=Leptospira ognonensis TaxID=2484945 RepID=A0A4V3JRB4_9LEPT|nr:alpha/beta hydrolase [Leptospira ognonensis]TGL59355.1 alpha/beta hydrolase [Leptospira ognonensis]
MTQETIPKRNATEWLASGKFFDYHKHQIFYINEGRGNHLLLLHGFPTSSWDYSKIFAGLSRHFNTYAIDFLGFGYSSKPKNHTYSILEQTDIIESFIEKNALKRVKFVFHDYAVSVGQELLARNLESSTKKFEIDGAVFLNGGLIPSLHRPTFTQKLLTLPILGPILSKGFNPKKFAKAFSEVFGPKTKPEAGELNTLWKLITYPGNIRIAHKLLHYIKDRKQYQERWVGVLTKTDVPLLFINGGSDPVSGRHLITEIEKMPIKNGKIIKWEEIGHYPQWENPEACFKEIYDFLKQN